MNRQQIRLRGRGKRDTVLTKITELLPEIKEGSPKTEVFLGSTGGKSVTYHLVNHDEKAIQGKIAAFCGTGVMVLIVSFNPKNSEKLPIKHKIVKNLNTFNLCTKCKKIMEEMNNKAMEMETENP